MFTFNSLLSRLGYLLFNTKCSQHQTLLTFSFLQEHPMSSQNFKGERVLKLCYRCSPGLVEGSGLFCGKGWGRCAEQCCLHLVWSCSGTGFSENKP